MGVVTILRSFWREYRSVPDFKRCPCNTCDGMVSTRERMIQGKDNWYCSEESRALYEQDAAYTLRRA